MPSLKVSNLGQDPQGLLGELASALRSGLATEVAKEVVLVMQLSERVSPHHGPRVVVNPSVEVAPEVVDQIGQICVQCGFVLAGRGVWCPASDAHRIRYMGVRDEDLTSIRDLVRPYAAVHEFLHSKCQDLSGEDCPYVEVHCRRYSGIKDQSASVAEAREIVAKLQLLKDVELWLPPIPPKPSRMEFFEKK